MALRLVTRLTPEQVGDLMRLFEDTYWASERSRDDVERMLSSSSFLFGVVDSGTDRLLAFARVLTDGVFRAVIFDVVVDPGRRGEGLARMLFDAIISHPILGEVEYLVLYCKEDVVGLYERFGFTEDCQGMRLMLRKRT
ncbi:MAG: GNAT family N-acetyltransferase [Methanomassiliicoccales archaeon]|jgi:ribosomal protein S18 acetylase RimI-like enzyme|nr:GNAT family N-acetyltransferase [Methanomassiliicoccales archaeon]